MTKNERFWWMVLVESERRMARDYHADLENPLFRHNANVEARITLRDKFGIDLDILGMEASDKVEDLIEKYRKNDEKEKAQKVEYDKLVAVVTEMLENK